MHRRILALDRLQRLAWLVAAGVGLVLVAVGVDWLVRWPMAVRLALLGTGLVLFTRALRSIIERCWRQAPSCVSTALRIEQVEPSMRGLLASALEFENESTSDGLKQAVVRQAREKFLAVEPLRRVRHAPAGWALLAMSTLLLAAGAWVASEPDGAFVGLRRTLTPWSGDRWLPRTVLQSEPMPQAVARGVKIPLRVRALRGDVPDLRVRARCTVQRTDGSSIEREIDLVRQSDGSFERPVSTEGERMVVRFLAGDGETEPVGLRVVTAPSIVSGRVTITPPTYAAGERPVLSGTWNGTAVSDSGPVLEGSSVEVRVQLEADALEPAIGDSIRVTRADGSDAGTPRVEVETGRAWRVSYEAKPGMEMVLEPVDASGIRATEPLRIALDVITDSAPSVAVATPESDEIVTAQAQVPFRIEARDDLALRSVGWTLDRQQRSGEPAPRRLLENTQDASGAEASVTHTLSVASVEARAGDTLLLRGTANDAFERSGARRPTLSSEPRRLRVVEREVLERQVRQQGSALRGALARLEAAQRELLKEPVDPARAATQASIAERIRQANQSTDDLRGRLQRNALGDASLAEALAEASRAGTEAAAQAEQAREALARPERERNETAARDAQERAAEQLAQAIDALDRDDDSAAMQRRADRLAESIAQLRKDLQQAAKASAGRTAEELDSETRQKLQDQANRQRAAAEETSAMIDELRARAERTRQSDPAQSRSMQQAAQEGEQGQASRRIDEAAERTERNQTAAADESLERAAEALEKVRDSLRQDRRARTEDLRRRLASLSETLKTLIAAAEATLPRIDQVAGGAVDQRDALVTELLRISTHAAAAGEEARQADRAMGKIASIVLRAAGRFDDSASSIRAETPDAVAARDAVSRGIELLREAQGKVAEERAKQDQAAAERERARFAREYRELAQRTRQSREAVAQTVPQPGARVDRRGAATQREQALVLQGIAQAVRSGPAASELLSQVEAFKSAHERIERELEASRRAFTDATGGASEVRRLDVVVGLLEGLAVSLADPEPGEQPFEDAQPQAEGASGGDGQDGAPRLPPITELRLVRQMQEQVNTLTRTLDEARAAGQPIDRELADVAAMQDEVRRLGDSWVERMREQMQSGPASKSKDAGVPAPGFLLKSARPMVQEAPKAEPPKTDSPSGSAPPSKTLDELLGITPPGGASGDTADRRRDRRLDRSLREEDLDDLAVATTESLAVASELVGDRRDIGVEAQRAQAEVLANIDALLDAATRFQRQQSSSSSSSSSSAQRKQSGQKQEKQEAQGKQEQAGEPKGAQERAEGEDRRRAPQQAGDASEPPAPEDPVAIEGVLEEGRSEWGSLPRRVREIMSQARRDRVSALYQQATEAYYRRLAERKDAP